MSGSAPASRVFPQMSCRHLCAVFLWGSLDSHLPFHVMHPCMSDVGDPSAEVRTATATTLWRPSGSSCSCRLACSPRRLLKAAVF